MSRDELTIYFTSLRAPTADGDIWARVVAFDMSGSARAADFSRFSYIPA